MTLRKRLFPTFVIGSLPRDQWVVDVVESVSSGGGDRDLADRLLDDAVLYAIRLQEQAGLDFVSDGEWRRNSYLRVFVDAVDGYELDALPPRRFSTSPLPAVVSRIEQRASLSVRAARFLKENARARTVVALPSPYTIGGKMWSAERSAAAYADPEEAMEACVPVINKELKALAALGVDAVQLDEPWLCDVPNPAYRQAEGIGDVDRELDLYLRSVNGAVEGVEGVSLAVHVCGHTSPATPESDAWRYGPLLEALGRMNVDRFTIAMAGPNVAGFEVLAEFPPDKTLGLGVVGTLGHERETSRQVVERVETAMEFVPKERIALNPDCGFAPLTRNRRDLDEVYLRLRTMCEAAEMLRERYG